MAKPKREKRKSTPYIEVFVEGPDEKAYFDILKKSAFYSEVKVTLKPIPCNGGGYTQFLTEVRRRSSSTGCIARFLVMDYDRCCNPRYRMDDEKVRFKEIVDFCNRENKYKDIPYFLIVSNPKFELLICLHNLKYQYPKDPDSFLMKEYGFDTIEQFKHDFSTSANSSNKYLGSDLIKSIYRASGIMKSNPKIVSNSVLPTSTGGLKRIKNKGIIWRSENGVHKNINMDEFFYAVNLLKS